MSNRNDIEAIKSRINLVDIAKRYVELKRAGGRWVAPCPFHNETKPSFSINEEEGFYYCFGCQASGDMIDFYCRINGLEFREGLVQLAEEAGVELSRGGRSSQTAKEDDFKRQTLKLHELALKHFSGNLRSKQGESARKYIKERKISQEMVDAFELGFAMNEWGDLADFFKNSGFSDESGLKSGLLTISEKGKHPYDRFRARVMFPIKNLSGRVIAFGGRIIENEVQDDREQAKYINSSDSPIYKKGEHLYGLFQARRSITHLKRALLTEGYLDVISLHQFGFTNACGVLGTALTKEQVKRLAGFSSTVELIFDGDDPGRKAALRSAEMILATGLNCRVVLLPQDEDIDSLLHNHGVEAFEKLRINAEEGIDYCITAVKSTLSPRETVEWLKKFINQIELPELISKFISRLAPALGIDEVQIRGQIQSRIFKKSGYSAEFFSGSGKDGIKKIGAAKPRIGWSYEAMTHTILHFLACFPGFVEQLSTSGCEKLMLTPFSKGIWDKLVEHGEDEAFEYFEPEEKEFWVRCRVAEPLPQANKDELLADIKARIEEISEKENKQTYKDVLRQLGAGKDPGLEILRVLIAQTKLEKEKEKRNSNGKH